MVIRPYVPADRPALLALRERHGEQFWFADPDDPLCPGTLVVEDEGRLVAALMGRISIEAFLMLDPGYGTSLKRWGLLKRLFAQGLRYMRQVTRAAEAYACIPPNLESYAGLLAKLPDFNPDRRTRFMVPLWNLKA